MKITFAYLSSLEWSVLYGKKTVAFECDNNEFYFKLTKEKKDIIKLEYVNIVNNIGITITHEKLINLWNELIKNVEYKQAQMINDIELE